MTPLLETRELGFAYGEREALSGVTLGLEHGEIVGVIGPNGSGKSTLVRVVAGLLAPYRGSVTLAGAELSGLRRAAVARRVAVVPAEQAFELPWTALEIALMGRHPHLAGVAFESAADLDLAHRALAAAGAADLAARRVDELSAGERQRVLFARALTQEPELLLLDEATSHLDLRFQVELLDRVRGLASAGTGVLAVVHDLNLAAEYCDRIAVLAGGRLVALGATAEVLTYRLLTEVFATEIYVDVHDLTGGLVITPLSARARKKIGDRPAFL